jgi:hypothetical protein
MVKNRPPFCHPSYGGARDGVINPGAYASSAFQTTICLTWRARGRNNSAFASCGVPGKHGAQWADVQIGSRYTSSPR